MALRISSARERREWIYRHPVQGSVILSILPSAFVLMLMLVWSRGRGQLPWALLPVVVMLFLAAFYLAARRRWLGKA